jgi:uroporphyrinogen decarboxylase
MTTPTTDPAATAPAGQPVAPMIGRARFLAAARGEPTDVTPVWYMRQAGRCLPEYRALRERHAFMEVATTPELAVEATLMPVDRFGVDGAVLFADIMLPLGGMGVPFRIDPGVGPVIDAPVRTRADVERLVVADADEATGYVMDALRLLRRELGDRAASLGFSGAPFTLACYLVEGRGSREYPRAKALMYGEPETWHRLMATLTEVVIRYLRAQVRAGADAVQLFDSWLGLLGPEEYRRHVQPYTARIFEALRGEAPAIHFSTGTGHLLPQIVAAGPDLVSVDWRIGLDDARAMLRPGQGVQGNLDPTVLLAGWDATRAAAEDVLRRAGGRPGHVFNLGHGILPATDPDVLARLTALVHGDAG